jgi:hypothetical protein
MIPHASVIAPVRARTTLPAAAASALRGRNP